MTPEQFQSALDRLELSQLEASRRLEVDGRTVRRWIAGDREIPGPVRVLLRTWLAHPKLLQD
jgi:DNA-binding transcriptional regulator YiaG